MTFIEDRKPLPFLKWAGGKRDLARKIVSNILPNTEYFEPFLGSGAVFFNTNKTKSYLSDTNKRLITTYQVIRDDPKALIDLLSIEVTTFNRLRDLHFCEKHYLQKRDDFNNTNNNIEVAALMIFLNKTGFNGMYRENKNGHFNIPFNKKTKVAVDTNNLKEVSKKLQGMSITCQDFNQVPITNGFYYFDPPYYKSDVTYGYGQTFTSEQHFQLKAFCDRVDASGGRFMLSSSDSKYIRGLFNGYKLEVVNAKRLLSVNLEKRGTEAELLIMNF